MTILYLGLGPLLYVILRPQHAGFHTTFVTGLRSDENILEWNRHFKNHAPDRTLLLEHKDTTAVFKRIEYALTNILPVMENRQRSKIFVVIYS